MQRLEEYNGWIKCYTLNTVILKLSCKQIASGPNFRDTLGHFTLAQLGARLGFRAEPELSHKCEHPAARIRNVKPTLKI